MSDRFDLYVSYSQIAVFKPGLDNPFNDWTEKDVEEGYSWSQRSVSFKTAIEAGTCSIEVVTSDKGVATAFGENVIEVPFEVPEEGQVEIASISDGCLVEVPAGNVTLRYEIIEESTLRLTFIRTNEVRLTS